MPEAPIQGHRLSSSSQPDPTLHVATFKHKTAIVIGLACVLIGAALLVFFGRNGVPRGPKLTVGNNAFVYACGVVDADMVAKSLSLNNDRSKQVVEERYAFDPANTADKQVDLSKLTGLPSATSSCQLKFDRKYVAGPNGTQTAEYINVDATLTQYATGQAASNEFLTAKNQAGGDTKALPSYKDSYFTPPVTAGSPATIQPVILYKNLLISYQAPVRSGDTSGGQTAAQLDTLTKDVVKRIASGDGTAPRNFNHTTKIGNNAFVDACQSTNFVHVAQAIGGQPALDPTSFLSTQDFAPEDNGGASPKQLVSSCGFSFRTQTDAAAQSKQKPAANAAPTTFQDKFPHYAILQIAETASKTDAQKLVSQFKANAEKQIQANPSTGKIADAHLGDKSLMFTQKNANYDDPSLPATTKNDQTLYYIAKGASVYLFSIIYRRQTDPYQTTNQTFSDSQMQQLLKALTEATAYAN